MRLKQQAFVVACATAACIAGSEPVRAQLHDGKSQGPTGHGASGHSGGHGIDYDKANEWGTANDKDKDKDKDNVTCALGKNQTPINLKNFIKATLPALKFTYSESANVHFQNNDHGFPQLDFVVKSASEKYAQKLPSGQTLEIDGLKFDLKQIHFHTPSENKIKDKSFAMEGHFVHIARDGAVAVLAVMFEEGSTANSHLAAIWSKLGTLGASNKVRLNPMSLLPSDHSYYRFNGSLTTPPCSEGLRWLVLKKSVPVSHAQVAAFKAKLPGGKPNARPLQDVNARPVLE